MLPVGPKTIALLDVMLGINISEFGRVHYEKVRGMLVLLLLIIISLYDLSNG